MKVSLLFCLLANALSLCLVKCQSSDSPNSPTAVVVDSTIVIDEDKANRKYDLAFVMGHFDPASHPDFVLIDTIHADRPGLYLHKDTYVAFQEMYDQALGAGVRLQIRSATRNFAAQKGIWERKWTGETEIESGQNASIVYPDPVLRATMILKYSSMPGSSRHHWGTDIDLNAFDNSWFESGNGLQIYQWLSEHADDYGFCQPYSAKGKERPYGYEEERWHWTYMPLSQPLTQMATDSLTDVMITGFLGSEVATRLKIVERYVLGINAECLKKG